MKANLKPLADESRTKDLPIGAAPVTPLMQMEHLLKVAGSVSNDANKAWAEVWNELKVYTDKNGQTNGQSAEGFAPRCGWSEFVEKFWMIKYYLDSVARICQKHE